MGCAVAAAPADLTEFDRPLDSEELHALSRRLGQLSPHRLAEVYRSAYEACRMECGQLPRAAAMQELVIAWKLAAAWERRGVGAGG
jgi:hypothetical protein